MNWRHAAFRTALLIVACAVAAQTTVRAQPNIEKHVNDPGVWKPWPPFMAVPSTRSDFAATSAEVKALEASLLELNAILRRAPGVATPRGFSVETHGNLNSYRQDGSGQPAGRTVPLSAALTFAAFPIFEYERNGKLIVSDTGETASMPFDVNNLASGLLGTGRPEEWAAIDVEGYFAPPAMGHVPGTNIPRFGGIAILKKNPASIWTPLSLRDSLTPVQTAREADLRKYREAFATAKAEAEVWRSPAARAERMATYKMIAGSIPDGAKYLAGIPEQEKAVERAMTEPFLPGGMFDQETRRGEAALAEVTTLLRELSPADLQAPACYVQAGTTLRERFKSGTMPGCRPIVRSNYAFFNRALPRSTPQVLVIGSIARCFDDQPARETSTAGCPANRKLLQTLDTQAVLDWLR